MTRTQYYTATSIDGYIADEHHSLEWLFEADRGSGGATTSSYEEFFAQVGAYCMGATTYEWVLAHEEAADWRESFGGRPGWVFTHRELPVDRDTNLTLVSGDVAPVHRAMTEAAGGRNIWLVGGGELAGQFADQGLLDELILSVAPVTLGAGAPLLPRRLVASRLALTSVERMGPFAALTYSVAPPAGAPSTA